MAAPPLPPAPLLRAPDGSAAGTGRGLGPAATAATLIDRVRTYDTKLDADRLHAAFEVAEEAHRGQRRENGDAYISHPLAVAEILAGYRLDADSIVTALLHDTVEDTGVTLAGLAKRFGPTVSGLVDGVTKLGRLELQSDRSKQAENFRKLVLAMSRDIRVLLVKLADRLHNMRTLHYKERAEGRIRIARETMEIYAPLAERVGMDAIKTELQSLSFQHLEPEAYATIQARLNFLRGQGAGVIDEVRAELVRVCHEAGISDVDVRGREKSPYSIWEKMKRRNVEYEQLSDIMAFRLLVPAREACYMALGAVHATFPVIPGRFKDYISTPKANGYKSLHTGVTLREDADATDPAKGKRNQKIEVQIRTFDMHEIAENGVAAHWAYKAGRPDAGPTFPWVRDLLEILDTSTGYDEFLENTKLELYQDQVFCFTPKGQLIQLPRGATPVDFAYAVHSQVGDRCNGARINGRLQALHKELQNGDQVEITTAKDGKPSPSWERFVVTGKARAHIRRHVASLQRGAQIDNGRAALTKSFREESVAWSEKDLDDALKQFKLASAQDLYAAVGAGTVGAKEVVYACYPELRRARAPRMVPLAPRAPLRAPSDGFMPVSGLVTGMAVHYAGCCHPLPGDLIRGIVTTGKGVTIHTRDCQALESFAATPERFIDVDWDRMAQPPRGVKPTYVGRVNATVNTGPSAQASLVNAVSKHDGSVNSFKVSNRQQDFMEVLMDVDVRDLDHLLTIIAGLRATSGVSQVERAKA